jgi:hypothetical protein
MKSDIKKQLFGEVTRHHLQSDGESIDEASWD